MKTLLALALLLCSLTAMAQLPTPTFSPNSSTSINTASFPVYPQDSTAGVTFCQTFDGTTPTAPTAGTCSGGTTTTFTGSSVSLTGTTTYTVIATQVGQTNSAAASITVTLPAIYPAQITTANVTNAYATPVTIQPPYGWTGCYTTTGTAPTAPTAGTCGSGSTTWTGAPITIPNPTASETVSVLFTKVGRTNTTVTTATYTVRSPQNWYVRPNGGTRYSTNQTSGQCNGMYDLDYPGTGVNQNCAFNDVRYLFQDSSYTVGKQTSPWVFPGYGWVIAGGDTVIIRGSIGTGASYRIGYQTNGSYCATGPCWGEAGNSADSGMPAPPSGSSTQHTKILGENYASCSAQSARAQIHGGWGVGAVMDFTGSSYVDAACLDITDFSNCGRDTDTVACQSNGSVVSDYAINGVAFYSTSTHISLTDVRIHGLASDGIFGSPGTGFVGTDLYILGNADAGWNGDPNDGTTGVGTLNVTNFNISWNGCVEEYPIVDPLPYFSCTDQSSGGYGDGFGTATANSPSPGWQVHFDQGIASYNTQDGLDALHIGGAGSTMTDTRVLAYGNEGQQLKVGGATATIQNSVIVGNCEAMSTQAIPGTPTGFGSLLAAPCRAGNTAVLINLTPGDPGTYQGNTLYSEGAVGLEIEFATANLGSTNTMNYNDNVFVGFYNSSSANYPSVMYSNGGAGGSGGTSALTALTNPGASWTNNLTYNQRSNFPCPGTGETAAICTSPQLVDMTYHPYGYGNMAPSSGTSAVVGHGVAISGITTDYNGVTRPNPPSIGAYEYSGIAPPTGLYISPETYISPGVSIP